MGKPTTSVNAPTQSTVNLDDVPELKMPPAKAYFWSFILWFMFVLDIMDRFTLAVCLPAIKKEFLLTDAQGGMLGTVFSLTMVIFSIPIGIVAFKWSRRKVCAIMVGFWSLATMGTGMANNYAHLIGARMATGLGEASYLSVAYALLSAYFPKNKRGFLLTIFNTGNHVGKTVGVMIAGYLAYHFGWRNCFYIVAIPGLIMAVFAWFLPDFKNEVKVKVDKMEQEGQLDFTIHKTGTKEVISYIFRSPAVFMSILLSAGFVMVNASLAFWGITIFTRTFDVNVKDAATFIGSVGIVTTLLLIPGGKLTDIFHKRYKAGRVIYSYFLGFGILASVIVFTMNNLDAKNLQVALISYGCLTVLLMLGFGNTNTITQDLLPPHYRTVASSFIPVSNQLIGGMTGPLMVGMFSDRFGISLGFGYVTAIAFTLIMVLSIGCKIFYEKDRKKLEAMGHFDLEKA
ncbi:MAG: major facilitator superfamily 1 [Firmicutes bacterium]|nr:major facilitator superfamily 1 [Bacillota bacterium]